MYNVSKIQEVMMSYRKRGYAKTGRLSNKMDKYSKDVDFEFCKYRIYKFVYNFIEKNSGRLNNDEIYCDILKLLSDNAINAIEEFIKKEIKSKDEQDDFSISKRKRAFRLYNDLDEYIADDHLKENIDAVINEELTSFLNTEINFKSSSVNKSILQIKKIFKLNDVEEDILTLYYFFDTVSSFENFVREVNNYIDIANSRGGITVSAMSHLLNLDKSVVISALRNTSPLVKYNILENDLSGINSEIVLFINGLVDKPLSELYYKKITNFPLQISDFDFPETDKSFLKDLLKNKNSHQNLKILLYGKPGTGKTEFARSLCREFEYEVYEINNVDNIDEDKYGGSEKGFRNRALYACQNTVDLKKSVIIIDEADDLLNAQGGFFGFSENNKKSVINNILDNSKATTIWITNKYEDIDDSTLRRFDYSLGFSELTYNQRKKIWTTIAEKYELTALLSSKDIETFADKYSVNAGVIDVALKNCSRILGKTINRVEAFSIISNSIKAYLASMDISTDAVNIRDAGFKNYSIEGLNIKEDISKNLTILKQFSEYMKNNKTEIRNMNILMYGPPGSGKTELAKYIARMLKKRIIIKKASDILNPYVGMNEKNLNRAFTEAQRCDSILFIDEIDTFLFSRENATKSWEVSIVNELLSNMENFRGIFIAATNYMDKLDFASIRRFNIKLQFDYLAPDGIVTFYDRFFAPLLKDKIDDVALSRLKNLTYLTPGDFKVVYQKYNFFNSDILSHNTLIDELISEISSKKDKIRGKIGFGV